MWAQDPLGMTMYIYIFDYYSAHFMELQHKVVNVTISSNVEEKVILKFWFSCYAFFYIVLKCHINYFMLCTYGHSSST